MTFRGYIYFKKDHFKHLKIYMKYYLLKIALQFIQSKRYALKCKLNYIEFKLKKINYTVEKLSKNELYNKQYKQQSSLFL